MKTTRFWIRGAVAGAFGAGVMAFWFLIVDAAAGQAFRTPMFMVTALLGIDSVVPSAGGIALYTLLHFGLFMALGVAVTWTLSKMDTEPNVLLGVVLGLFLFALMFYTSATVTGVAVVEALGWPALLIGNVLAGITVFGFLTVTGEGRRFPILLHGLDDQPMIREGILIGLIGASVMAFGFLLRDLLMLEPFYTPAALGSALFLGAIDPTQLQTGWAIVLGYTLFHGAAFVTAGIILTAFAWKAEGTPHLVLGAVMLFAVFEAFFLAFTGVIAEFILGTHSWWTVAAGNLVAALAMAYTLWRRHPELRSSLKNFRMGDEETVHQTPGTLGNNGPA